jgi:hypothetical protein
MCAENLDLEIERKFALEYPEPWGQSPCSWDKSKACNKGNLKFV